MQNCSHVLTVWDLFTVGRGGQTDWKLIWDRSVLWKWKEEQRQIEGEQRKRPGKQRVWARRGLWVLPVLLCLHIEKFLTISQLCFSVAIERDRFLPGYSPSIHWEWLLSWENPNLWHPQWVTSLRCAIASVQTAAPRNACEICVHAGSGAHCWD